MERTLLTMKPLYYFLIMIVGILVGAQLSQAGLLDFIFKPEEKELAIESISSEEKTALENEKYTNLTIGKIERIDAMRGQFVLYKTGSKGMGFAEAHIFKILLQRYDTKSQSNIDKSQSELEEESRLMVKAWLEEEGQKALQRQSPKTEQEKVYVTDEQKVVIS